MLDFGSHLNPFCLEFQPKDFVCGVNHCHHSPLRPRSIAEGLKGGRRGLVRTTEQNPGESLVTHPCCLFSAQDTWWISMTQGARKKWKVDFFSFFKCKLPSPITPNWTNEVSLGLRLCHVTSYLGMLQTFWIVGCDNPEWGIFIFPPALKRQLPSLQGNRFCYLSLTALPVDYKALGKEKKRTHPPWFFRTFFPPLASLLPVLRQRHLMEHLYLESRRNGSSPLHPGKQQPQAPASVLQLRGGVRCLEATALQSPSKPLVVLFIRISIIHSRTSLLHRSGGE